MRRLANDCAGAASASFGVCKPKTGLADERASTMHEGLKHGLSQSRVTERSFKGDSKTRTFPMWPVYVRRERLQNREWDRSARMVLSHIPEAAWTVEQLASSRLALFGWDVRKMRVDNRGGQFSGAGRTRRIARSLAWSRT